MKIFTDNKSSKYSHSSTFLIKIIFHLKLFPLCIHGHFPLLLMYEPLLPKHSFFQF